MGLALPIRIKFLAAAVALTGLILQAYLGVGQEWSRSVLAGSAFFVVLIIVTGSFLLPVASRATTDISTAVLFTGALVLEPGIAIFTAVIGKLASYICVRHLRDRLRLPGYKYPFNLGEVEITAGVTSFVFHALGTSGEFVSPAVIVPAGAMYLFNTSLVTAVVSVEIKINPLAFWWMDTRENGAAEVSLLCFGFLGAVVYGENPWASAALILPVGIIHLAFSRLASVNTCLEETLERLESPQGRIVSSAKLASIGAISLDMAHQIKNLLAIILGRLEGMQDRLDEGSRDRKNIEIAQEAGWRIQELTQTFNNIGRQQWVALDIRTLLDEGTGMAGLRTAKRIGTNWSLPADLPQVHGNLILIREALSNFFSNATDATDVTDAVGEDGEINVEAGHEGEFVTVKIIDNGVGISLDELKHLFQPFHTTKPHGQGLGLFASRHILEMH